MMYEKLKFKNGWEMETGTMYGIGKNYAKHAREMGGEVPKDPVVFLKPPAAYVSTGSEIKLPDFSENVHHEVELVVIIGKDCMDVNADEAFDYIAGYGVGIDFTLRDLQAKAKQAGLPWTVAKGFYQSAPISEIVPAEEIKEKAPVFDLELKVNGEIRQSGSTKDMERPVDILIEYLSHVFTLRKGDVIFTGTPEGVGQIKSGDKIEAELKGFAELKINVK